MSEQDLVNLRKLAEQQKELLALKIKNRFLKQARDIKLAESLSPITKNIDEVKEFPQKLGKFIKEYQPKKPQLSDENTPTRQLIEHEEGAIYDVELEDTLKNIRDNLGFFKTHEDSERRWMLKNYPIKMLRGTEVEIDDKEYNITPAIQKVFTDKSYITAKSMNDMEKLVLRDILQKTEFYKRLPTKGRVRS